MTTWDRRILLLSLGSAAAAPAALARQPREEDVSFPVKVAIGAELRAKKREVYDPAYVKLAYPMGDVPDDRGVCTDTVIRAFRHAGVDLQVEVHRDMKAHFDAYPKAWGLAQPDRNIDHRRVPNLETFFRRKGAGRTLSRTFSEYQAGDIVSWRLFLGGTPHIGVVTRKKFRGEPVIAHNIGAGTKEETCLFNWPIEGWYRFERWA